MEEIRKELIEIYKKMEDIKDKMDKLELSGEQTKKKKKPRKTLFWGINLDTNLVMNHPPIKDFLDNHSELIPLKSIHSTLLYVGRKENEDEKIFEEHQGKICQLEISGYGYSENALALKVNNITFGDDEKVPSFAETQHITIALSERTKAIDSVKTLQGEGEVIEFEQSFIIEGRLWRY